MSKYLKDSFAFPLLKPLISGTINEPMDFPVKIISFKGKDSLYETICHYAVTDTSCGFLLDGYGHEIFVIPGDTVHITVTPRQPDDPSASFRSYTAHDLNYSGPKKFIYSLFDSLSLVNGDLRFTNINMKESSDDLDNYYQLITRKYAQRADFLTSYCTRHLIPTHFAKLAQTEIFSAYIDNLFSPVFLSKYNGIKFPIAYQKTLDSVILNDEYLYFKTFQYQSAAFSYLSYSANKNTGIFFSDKNAYLIKLYSLIKTKCADRMRDNLLVHLFEWNIKKQTVSYDSLLNDFWVICKRENYTSYLNALIQQESKKKLSAKSISLADAFQCIVENLNGDSGSIKKFLSRGKPFVIDCWASWCGPCIAEMPFENKFEKKYTGKIDFYFLSFDRNRKDWDKKSKQLKITENNFLLTNNFLSNFALHFGIDFIPRYLLFDKNGNLFSEDAGKPSKTAAFSLLLEKLVSM